MELSKGTPVKQALGMPPDVADLRVPGIERISGLDSAGPVILHARARSGSCPRSNLVHGLGSHRMAVLPPHRSEQLSACPASTFGVGKRERCTPSHAIAALWPA